ncbi:MAG TPA: ABC transporter permease [Rhizobiales bacterium]|nr:ABC transporter permease [Hyphomicrobiales bacterium]HAN62332.1 ABC transporter permease [Hyphomicrobiales bacterium]
MNLLVHLQGWMHGLLAAHMTGFAASRDWSLLAAMLPLGIVFGSIHALMPGHGKSVLASYLVGSPLSALRSVLVASVQALTQSAWRSLSLSLPCRWSRARSAVGRAPSIELLSRVLLVAVALWLLLRAWRGHKHEHAEGEGAMVGVIAGLVPCPLTLFAMAMALARGVPEAGIAFAFAMMLGVGLTLGGVALLATLARTWVIGFMSRHGRSAAHLSRLLDGASGALLMTIGLHELIA